ncbi:MAG TPA: hypothetical protein HA257_05085 [Candidatus Methanoperedenaceae archaeon]|nr:hypothetical protein [Candidatus Methanoperedenaceae archaeon]
MIRDESGVETIPLKIVVYTIIIGVILGTAMLGLSNIEPKGSENSMEKQLGKLKASVELMQDGSARNLGDPSAPAGNIRTFLLDIPDNIEYVSFGVDPDPDSNGILGDTPPGLTTDSGDVIYYGVRGGGKNRVLLDPGVQLREGEETGSVFVPAQAGGLQQGFVMTGAGEHRITFELVFDPVTKERYTLSHSTDELFAYINQYNTSSLPNGLSAAVSPGAVPADGTTSSMITVQVIDAKGRRVKSAGKNITLSASLGGFNTPNLTTDSYGRAAAYFTSDSTGVAVVNATSPGIHPASTYLTVTPVPIRFLVRDWIYTSKTGLLRSFYNYDNATYSVSITAYGTEAHWPFQSEGWPIARMEIDGEIAGEVVIDSGTLITRDFPRVWLDRGGHTVRISMPNDLNVPLMGDRNLYVEEVVLS